MKKPISIILIILFVQIITFGQNVNLPKEITITDKYFSPWGTNVEYKYTLELVENKYQIVRVFQNENGKLKKKQNIIGAINIKDIEDLINLIKIDSTYELKYQDFSEIFTKKNASDFIQKEGDNYWITTDIQKDFILTNLTDRKEVENNLKSYYKNSDHSGWIDGSSTEISISFSLDHKNVFILTQSILEFALPIIINNKSYFNPEFSEKLAKIIPASKTNRQQQLSGKGLFNSVARETIGNNRRKLDELDVLNYRSEIDSLKKYFKITNLRVVNGTSSINWNGEKRFNCLLLDTLSANNVTVMYSSKIENNAIKYSPLIVINKYDSMVEKLLSIDFFKDFLAANANRKMSIIFDDNSCFTEKTKERLSGDCDIEIDFANSLFLAVWDEDQGLSNWIILPDNNYFLWMEINGSAIKPDNDKKFIRCKE